MSSLKFDLLQLDYTMRFSLWQVKMRAILTQSSDLDEALDGFGKKDVKTWTDDEKRKDHWFSSYEFVQSGDVVRMGDNNPREIVSIGSVQIKMHDGMTRTLTDVRHIPGMARNLISLSTLDVDGYKHSGSRGVLKVSKVSLVHVIGDMNSAKIYVLRGSTLSGIVAAVIPDEPGKTNLWHMRLGHMSEHGMAELHRRDLLDGCNLSKFEFCEHCIFATKALSGTTPSHIQNGVAERMNRTIISKARCMLSNADVTDAVDFSNSDDEQQRISVQVEHVEEKENNVAEIDNIVVQHSPPVLQQTNSSIVADRPRRNKGPRPRLIEECNLVHHALSCSEQVEHDTKPATYTEAVASVDRVKWVSAMQEEMQSLDKNGTWDVVPLPKQKKVVAHSYIRAFFVIVAMHDLELEQLDVKTAFLHGELEERYTWTNLKILLCLFVNGSPIYLLLYVDDMLIAAKSKKEITTLKSQLSSEFEMKDLGAAKKILEIPRAKIKKGLTNPTPSIPCSTPSIPRSTPSIPELLRTRPPAAAGASPCSTSSPPSELLHARLHPRRRSTSTHDLTPAVGAPPRPASPQPSELLHARPHPRRLSTSTHDLTPAAGAPPRLTPAVPD
ncbi:hypothetical protein QYE76_010439 [Lolium multiflorum]|uniref:Gag-pol polyprotein n=1 Tax=Lolium multiflorum TaxID=4521 RepID=A0AAD8TVK2_LOLMU|nr:hypothetical protein QYE76_010439 [Lolium multiflorum]